MKRRLPIGVRLALITAVATAVFLSLVGTGLYFRTKASLDGGIDANLRARASDLEVTLGHATNPQLSAGSTTFEQLITSRGVVVAGAKLPPLVTDLERREASRGPIFRWRGEEARLLAVPVAGDRVLVVGTSIASRERALESLATALIIGIPIASLLAGLAAYAVARQALVPVQRLRLRAAELATADGPERLVIPETHDEIEDLARTFDELLAGLSEARRHEREFVANASHQLRTPLAIIEAELELALDDTRGHVSELRKAISSAHDEARQLSALAGRLLRLSVVDEGALPLDLQPIDVAPIAKDAVRRFAPRAHLEGRVIRFDGRSEIAVCDHERVAEVLDLLVDNALVHGDGDVLLTVSSEDGWVRMSVSDDGVGVPEGTEKEVLQRFVTYGSSSKQAGLGLSIADSVIAAHGGKLELHRKENRTFIDVLLPRS